MINYIDKANRQVFKYDEKIGHKYIENIETRIINENGGYFLKTNSSGFRSDIEFRKKKGKQKRILFFGDSNTAGDGVSNKERYSDLLGNKFNCEVYNYGVSGTGTDQQYIIWKDYAKKVDADLIVLGVLVENIERIQRKYRETLNFYNKEKTLTPKPFFNLERGKLKIKNYPVPRFFGNHKLIDKNDVQWMVPEDRKYLYKIKDIVRDNKLYKYLNKNFEPTLDQIRTKVVGSFYDPHKDYSDPTSYGSKLLKKILEEFTSSVNKTPIIIFPIPTYHYYFDGVIPNYQNLFNKFHDPKKKIYVFDPVNELKSLEYKTKKSLCFISDKSHFSPHGHKNLSNFLEKKIDKFGILKKTKKIHKTIKKRKENYILGISAFYHDSAASLIKNGKVIAASQEERFSRVKNDKSFPANSINFCLEQAKINSDQLSAIIYYDNSYITFERILWSFVKTYPQNIDIWMRYLPSWIQYKFSIPQLIRKQLNYNGKIFHDLHHRSHLSSAFFPSPFEKAAILTIDGTGEWATASYGVGEGNKITMIEQMNFPNSLRLLYSAFTQFIGFEVNSGEYKMMGLAPYGEPIYEDIILKNLVHVNEDGSIIMDQSYFEYIQGNKMTNQKFADLFGGNPREPDSKITRREMNIAASIQKVTEKIIFKMAKYVKVVTKADYLCLSGGVALNCVINGNLQKSNIFKKIWVQPASGDAGSSLGCAYDLYHTYFQKKRELRKDGYPTQLGSYLGPSWSDNEIKSFLETGSIKYKYYKNKNKRNKDISNLIKKQKVIGYFTGRSEFGPRSLGSRSILADPRSKNMQTKLNLKIKFRESFRPFAPAILKEKVRNYFDSNHESPYMTFVSYFKKKKRISFKRGKDEDMLKIVNKPRSEIPAVTHLDYSARIQTVDKVYNKDFYDLIKIFFNSTGCPVLINTSFNVRGEPIVNSPLDAFRCFTKTEIDILVLENFIIEKQGGKVDFKRKFEKNNCRFYFKDVRHSYLDTTADGLNKPLRKIYFSLPECKKENISVENGWIKSDDNEKNIKDIFEIPKSLDSESFDVHEATKELTSYWKNKALAKDCNEMMLKLMTLVKNNNEKLNLDTSFVSSNIYELF